MADITEHREVWALLPWYLNNTLSQQEQARVQAHLAECDHCRAELAREESLAAGVQQQPQGEWRPTLAKFDALIGQIEQNDAPVAKVVETPSLLMRLKQWFDDLGSSAPSVRWTMAAQGALAVVLAVALVVVEMEAPDEGALYQTFSTPETPMQSAGQIRLVVDDQITERELRELLLTIDATIVQGPTRMGVYTLALMQPGDVELALQTLRGNSRVKLAEPLAVQP